MSHPAALKKLPLSKAFWFQEGPGVRRWQFLNSGIKLLNVSNITKSGILDLEKTDRCLSEEEVAQKYTHFLVDEGDLVIASSGISFDEDNLLRTRGVFVLKEHLPLCMNTSTIRFKAKNGVSDLHFLKHWLNSKEFRTQITRLVTGSAQQNFGPSHLNQISISLPDPTEQRRIAAILDKADAIRRKRQEALRLTDEFLRSTFLEMFGDPVTNPKGWVRKPIGEFGCLVTGNTPSRENPDFYGSSIEWIKSDNINTPFHVLTPAAEALSEEGRKVGRIVPSGSILVTCIAGTPECIGNIAIADRDVAFNQQINAIVPKKVVNMSFLYVQLLVAKQLVQRASTASMKGMVSKSNFSAVELISPPKEMQDRFGRVFENFYHLFLKEHRAAGLDETCFESLMQKAFQDKL